MISASIALGIALGGVLGSFTASHPLDVNAAEGDKYVLLDPSDVGSLKDTQTVLIASPNVDYIMGPQSDTVRSRVSVLGSAYDEASRILTGTSAVTKSTEFHLAKVGDYWTIQEVEAGTYLYYDSGNTVSSGNGSVENDSSYQWSLEQSSNLIKIVNCKSTVRFLQYNASASRFACYQSSSKQQNVNIFVKQEAPDYTVDSITVEKGEGAKDTYLVGEVFESAGYTVTAHYSNSTTADVTAEVIWPTNPLTIEDTSVEISYTFFDKTVNTTIPVTVQNREVTGITIQSEPTKTEYGLNETLDLSGLVVMATYNAGEPSDVTASVTTDPVNGAVLSEAGEIVVKVTYEGQEATFKINVSNSITGSYTLLPYGSTGDGIALTKGSSSEAQWDIPNYVTVTLANGGGTDIRYNAGDGHIRFYSKNTITITPLENVKLTQIVVDSLTGEHLYKCSEDNATSTISGSTVTITPINPSKPVVITNTASAQARFNSITVEYVYSAGTTWGTLDHIEVNAGAAKTNYVEGDAFTSAGLVVTAYDDQGNNKIVDTGYTVDLEEGTILDTIETKVITVSYTEGVVTKTATYEIVIAEKADYSYVFKDADYENNGETTKNFDGIEWTLKLEGNGTISNFDDSKGLHFGTNDYKYSQVSLRSELFYAKDAAALKTIVVNASGSSKTDALLSVKVGDTVIGTAQELTSLPVDYTFVVPNALMGHIEILFTPKNDGADLGAAVYVKSIAVYADETNLDASLALLVAQEIEAADVCNDELTALQKVKQDYDDLGAEGQALINNVYLDDYADGDTAHTGAKVYNRLTVEEKMAAIESAIATKSIEASSFGAFGDKNNTTFITLLSLASLIGVGGIGFFFLKKKKGAH